MVEPANTGLSGLKRDKSSAVPISRVRINYREPELWKTWIHDCLRREHNAPMASPMKGRLTSVDSNFGHDRLA
jgi:hypothetical protein